jgi:pyruvate/2-oxoglutarate/acetoin dehydrogenase E1 component
MTKKYVPAINEMIANEIKRFPNAVFYGENIDTGSCLSGLSRNFDVQESSRIINIGNCEYTHCGAGFGMMLNGATAVLFVKQLDFMLLGIDHFVSTYQSILCQRDVKTLGSFTIVVVAYDQGFQGPQSSFNALGDMCSIARVPGYTLTNNQDSAHVLKTQLGQPGFRFIVLNQRHSSTDLLQLDLVHVTKNAEVFQYTEGSDVTIACFNFSTPEGIVLHQKLQEQGMSSSVFSVNNVFPHDWTHIKEGVARTGRLVVLDDSKSVNLKGYTLLHEVAQDSPGSQRIIVKREDEIDFGVSPDSFQVDYDTLISSLVEKTSKEPLVNVASSL